MKLFTRARMLVAAGALVAAGIAGAPSASADTRPPGSWTQVRSDVYVHYACKTWVPNATFGALYRVKTLTNFNGDYRAMQSFGTYAAVARGSNANVVAQVSNNGWYYGWNGNELWASALLGDRLWIQGAYYGPARPWTDGYPVAALANCS